MQHMTPWPQVAWALFLYLFVYGGFLVALVYALWLLKRLVVAVEQLAERSENRGLGRGGEE